MIDNRTTAPGWIEKERVITLTWHCMGDTSQRLAGLAIVANADDESVATVQPPLWEAPPLPGRCEDDDTVPLCPFAVLVVAVVDDAKFPLEDTRSGHTTKATFLLDYFFMTHDTADVARLPPGRQDAQALRALYSIQSTRRNRIEN